MDIGSLLLGAALLVVIAFIVVRPLLERKAVNEPPAGLGDELLGNREQVLTQLRDLDFDHAMGKINEVDYAAQRNHLRAEGVAILKQLDVLGAASGRPVTPIAPSMAAAAPEDEIEAAVAQMRARRAAASRPKPVKPSPVSVAPASSRPAVRSVDADIEASIAQRRAARSTRPAATEKPSAAASPMPAETGPAAAGLTCAQCGTEVLPDDRFCPKCGSALMIVCGNCGTAARAGDQFCARCGRPLPATAGPAVVQG